MSKSANLYFCKNCDEPNTSVDAPKKCKKCGGKDFDKLEGVTASLSEESHEEARV